MKYLQAKKCHAYHLEIHRILLQEFKKLRIQEIIYQINKDWSEKFQKVGWIEWDS